MKNPVRFNPNRPKVPDIVPLIRAVYETPDGGAGCCLHVVTDDGNWDCAESALRWAIEADHPACVAAAEMMVQMTESQVSRATERAFAERAAERTGRTAAMILALSDPEDVTAGRSVEELGVKLAHRLGAIRDLAKDGSR